VQKNGLRNPIMIKFSDCLKTSIIAAYFEKGKFPKRIFFVVWFIHILLKELFWGKIILC